MFKQSKIHVIRVSKEEENGEGGGETIKPQIQKSQPIQRARKMRKPTWKYILIKFFQNTDKGKVFRATQAKSHVMYLGT